MLKLLYVMLGGAVGAGLRYGVYMLCDRYTTGPFPYGTLTVNVVGCGLIGVLAVVLHIGVPDREHDPLRLLLVVGLLGGFTTFSAFGYDTLKLLNDQRVGLAMVNVVANNVVGLVAVWVAYRVTQRFVVAS